MRLPMYVLESFLSHFLFQHSFSFLVLHGFHIRPLDYVVYMEVWECCNDDRMVSGICKGHVSIP